MRILVAGLIIAGLAGSPVWAQSPTLSEDAASGAASLGLSGPPSQSDRDIVIRDADPEGGAADAAPDGPDAQTTAPSSAATAPGAARAADDASTPTDAPAAAQTTPAGEAQAGPSGETPTETPAETPAPQGEAPATDAAPAPDGRAGGNAAEQTPDAEATTTAEDDEAEADNAAAVAAGALGITSPPETMTSDADAPDPGATAAGALGITSPPDTGGGGDPAATAAGALGLSGPPAATTTTAADAETYVVAILDDAPPFSFAGRFGVRAGFDVDLVNALCTEIRARCQMMPMPAEDIVQALLDRRVDFAVASPAITEQSGALVNFSEPYLSLSVRFVTPGSLRGDVENDKAAYGALAGTSQAAYLQNTYKEPGAVRLYPQADGMWIDLALGRLNGVLAPAITARREFLSTPMGDNFRFAPTASAGESNLARNAVIGIRAQDPELLNEINRGLAALRSNGEFADLLSRHLDRDLVNTVESAP